MKSSLAGTIQCFRIDVVIGAFALAAAWLLPLRADESAGTIQRTRPAKRQTTETQSWEARLRLQRFVVRKAEAEYYNSRLAREIAEIEIQQYVECIFPQELANANAEIKRAESDLKRAENRLDWLKNNSYKGFPRSPRTTDELGAKKARFAREQALSKKLVLTEYAKTKRTRELNAEADKARSVELAKKRAWELEKSKQSVIEQQIAHWQPVFAKRGEVLRSLSVHGAFRDEA